MELLLINHPLDCPICDKGGECPLQNQAMSNGRPSSRFLDPKRTFAKPIAISTEILLDPKRSVPCQRCTRFSAQIADDPFIDFGTRPRAVHRRRRGQAVPELLLRQHDPDLSGRGAHERRLPVPVPPVRPVVHAQRLRHCACGTASRTDTRRGVVMRRMAGNDPAVNEEWISDKARFAFRYITSATGSPARWSASPTAHSPRPRGPTRWRSPRGGSWPRVRAALGRLRGGGSPSRDAYAYAKFARWRGHQRRRLRAGRSRRRNWSSCRARRRRGGDPRQHPSRGRAARVASRWSRRRSADDLSAPAQGGAQARRDVYDLGQATPAWSDVARPARRRPGQVTTSIPACGADARARRSAGGRPIGLAAARRSCRRARRRCRAWTAVATRPRARVRGGGCRDARERARRRGAAPTAATGRVVTDAAARAEVEAIWGSPRVPARAAPASTDRVSSPRRGGRAGRARGRRADP